MSSLSAEEWDAIIENSPFFKDIPRLWKCGIRLFGTVNIFYILRLRYLLDNYQNNVGATLNSQVTITEITNAIVKRQNLLRTHPNIDEIGPTQDEYNFFQWFRVNLQDRQWRRHYAEAIQGQEHWTYNLNLEADIPLCDQITFQQRQSAPQPPIRIQGQNSRRIIYNRNNRAVEKCGICHDCGHTTMQCPYRCKYCANSQHSTARCPDAGSVRRNNRGEMIALGSRPKCFVCAVRDKKISDTNFHSSENCRLRNPLSRIGVERRCTDCRSSMMRCWNCAIPVCKNRRCHQSMHRLSTCTVPRFVPIDGTNELSGISIRERMRMLGIRRVPREIRFIRIAQGNEGTGDDNGQANAQEGEATDEEHIHRGHNEEQHMNEGHIPEENIGQEEYNEANPEENEENFSRENFQQMRTEFLEQSSSDEVPFSSIENFLRQPRQFGIEYEENILEQNIWQEEQQDDESQFNEANREENEENFSGENFHENFLSHNFRQSVEGKTDLLEDILSARENANLELQRKQEICPICLQDVNKRSWVMLKCKHQLHTDCLETHKKFRFNFCPLCRANLKEEYREEPLGASTSSASAPLWENYNWSHPGYDYNYWNNPRVNHEGVPIEDDEDDGHYGSFNEGPSASSLNAERGNMWASMREYNSIRNNDNSGWNDGPVISSPPGTREFANVQEKLVELLINLKDNTRFTPNHYHHLTQLRTLIRSHGLVWTRENFNIVGAILFEAARRHNWQVHRTIFPDMLDRVHSEEELHQIFISFRNAANNDETAIREAKEYIRPYIEQRRREAFRN